MLFQLDKNLKVSTAYKGTLTDGTNDTELHEVILHGFDGARRSRMVVGIGDVDTCEMVSMHLQQILHGLKEGGVL